MDKNSAYWFRCWEDFTTMLLPTKESV
jgi:hypothetical protein